MCHKVQKYCNEGQKTQEGGQNRTQIPFTLSDRTDYDRPDQPTELNRDCTRGRNEAANCAFQVLSIPSTHLKSQLPCSKQTSTSK